MMKKIIQRTLAVLCAVTLVFTLAGCSGSDDKNDSSKDASDNSAASESTSGEDTPEEITGKFASIQDFIDSDLFRKHMESKIADFEEKGLAMSFDAEGSKLIWNFKITDPDLSGAMEPSSLESALDSQASSFEAVADTLMTAVDVDAPVVLVRYLDDTGSELASKEFGVSAQDDAADAAPDDSSDDADTAG